MSKLIKEWPYGLSFDDFEERLEQLKLGWSEEKKVVFWKHFCSHQNTDSLYDELVEAISLEDER
tara:strand:+ start:103 stop:294 length:192 start_codon:yes stop_codon:yes gene_type:complete